ncbi:MAG: non-hydrolyzing UDP-N-acetylglucosamine 2-epimerase [Candidatus Hodarchaeales archaeon]|jgi:UDP-N-acetylglucosamine 2-epimerase
MSKNYVLVTGTRPQIIKTAPILREASKEANLNLTHIFTGQHYESYLADVFFSSFELKAPDFNLDVRSGNPGYHIYAIMKRLIPILEKIRPRGIIVPGDTNSALAAGLSGMSLSIPILHLESGLRSNDLKMQEEINRRLIDHGSSVLFTPTSAANKNLKAESVKGKIVFSGDTMCDLLIAEKHKITKRFPLKKKLESLNISEKNYILMTMHRRENLSNSTKFRIIFETLGHIESNIIFPIHPHTRKVINSSNIVISDNIHLIDPLGYQEFLNLVFHSALVLTDSGGLQKEAYMLEVPCITLRNSTEWVETIENDANRIVGSNPSLITNAIHEMYEKDISADYELYGGGKASKRIIRELMDFDPIIPTIGDL